MQVPGWPGWADVGRGYGLMPTDGSDLPGSGTGEPSAVILLGYQLIKGAMQVAPYRRYGILLVEERDGALKLAAVAAKLKRGHGVKGVLGLVYCWRLPSGRDFRLDCGGRHWSLFPYRQGWLPIAKRAAASGGKEVDRS
jgi:hypothetical protein